MGGESKLFDILYTLGYSMQERSQMEEYTLPKIRGKKTRYVGISLTEQAILQIEMMLVAEYRLHRKRLPAQWKLRKIAEKYHKKHFG